MIPIHYGLHFANVFHSSVLVLGIERKFPFQGKYFVLDVGQSSNTRRRQSESDCVSRVRVLHMADTLHLSEDHDCPLTFGHAIINDSSLWFFYGS